MAGSRSPISPVGAPGEDRQPAFERADDESKDRDGDGTHIVFDQPPGEPFRCVRERFETRTAEYLAQITLFAAPAPR